MRIIESNNSFTRHLREASLPLQILSDCAHPADQGARTRLATYGTTLGFRSVDCHGIQTTHEAALNVVDCVDTCQSPAVMAINIAPRGNGDAPKGENGTPFGFTKVGDLMIVTTMSGHSLSLLKKFGVLRKVTKMHTVTALEHMYSQGFIKQEAIKQCAETQFRSLWFQVLVAAYFGGDGLMPGDNVPVSEILDLPPSVLDVDHFGNAKLGVLPEEIGFEPGKTLELFGRKLTCYAHLKDVPYQELALCVGSSGLNEKRLVEVVMSMGSAAKKLRLQSGTLIE